MKFFPSLLLSLAIAGCAASLPQDVKLSADGEQVDFAADVPSTDAYTVVGTLKADAAGPTIDSAIDSAKNDLRNKAAALGASLLYVDDTKPDQEFTRDLRVAHIRARAFKAKE
jgi:hypothetical protein